MILAAILLMFVLPGQAAPDEGVKAAEAARLRALIEGDVETLRRVLADELTYTHSTARIDTKDSYMEPLLAGRTRYTSLEPSGVVARVYGQVAILTGTLRSVALVGGRESRTHMRFTSTWIQRDGRWQMVAWQSTRMPD